MRKSLFFKIAGQLICILATALFLFPLVLMLIRSFKGEGLHNYVRVFETVNLAPNFLTSITVVFGTLLIVSAVAAMAAFAFSKLDFPFKKAIYYMLLTGMMIPTSALIFPLFQIVKGLKINNTPFSLIFPYATLNCCFNLMVLKNYFDALPNELIEAAVMDGCKELTIYHKLVLPLVIPALVTQGVMTFIGTWNSYLTPLIVLNDKNKFTLPLMIATVRDSTHADYGAQYVGMLVSIIPMVIVFCFASRIIMEKISIGAAVKG